MTPPSKHGSALTRRLTDRLGRPGSPTADRLAVGALAAVLIVLAAFVVGAMLLIRHETKVVRDVTSVSSAYETALGAAAEEQALIFEYEVHPSARVQRAFVSRTREFDAALRGVVAWGNAGDRRLARELLSLHKRLPPRVEQLFVLVDRGRRREADRFEHARVRPVTDRIEKRLARVTVAERSGALTALTSLRRRSTFLLYVSPIAFMVGIVLLAGLLRALATYRRRMEEGRGAELDRLRLQAQLQHSQRLETVGELAGGVAHDFNNLLAVIENYASFASQRLEDRPDVQRDIEEVRRAATAAATLTRKLLVFSRRDPPTPEVADIEAVLHDVEQMIRRVLGERVDVALQIEGGLHPVEIDKRDLEQVVLNLSLNARDAMHGGGRLEIEAVNMAISGDHRWARLGLEPGDYVRVTLSDDGAGMDDAVRQRAFEPFFTTKPGNRGTGLGLSVVYGIVKQAGGHVEIHSEPGRGTAVVVLLPRSRRAVEQPDAPRPLAASAAQGETVLLVEDSEPVRALAKRILTEAGYEVIEAADGPDAIALADERDRPVDVLVSDVVMPTLSGPDLAEQLHRRWPDLKVVLVSGYAEELVAGGGDGLDASVVFLEKPFRADQLLEKVHGLLRQPPRGGVADGGGNLEPVGQDPGPSAPRRARVRHCAHPRGARRG